MTENEATQKLDTLLAKLKIKRGEVVYLAVDMAKVPLPRWSTPLSREGIRSREERWCAFLFDRIMARLGPDGTILVGTFTYSCGNSDIPFVIEQTPSEIGPFTNWLRRQPKAIRSLHPIFSVSGIGTYAKKILSDTGGTAFGPNSPFGRISKLGARFVNLGIPFHQSLTYVHHLEQCHGCNHRYHKPLMGKVFSKGKEVSKQFFGYLRWRGVDASVDVRPLEDELRRAQVLSEVDSPEMFGQSARASDIDQVGYAMLANDSCAFSTRKICVGLDDTAVASNHCTGPIVTYKLVI